MPASEATILAKLLLTPAPLNQVLTIDDFASLFESSYRDHPDVKRLYREFQRQRNALINEVDNNIQREVQAGSKLRRQIAVERRNQESMGIAEQLDIRMNAEVYQLPLCIVANCPLITVNLAFRRGCETNSSHYT
jgi:hypothetical protein